MENQDRQDEPGAISPSNQAGRDCPSQASHIDFHERGRGLPLKGILAIALLVAVAVIILAHPYNPANSGGSWSAGSGNYSVPLGGTPGFFLKEGQFRSFDFAGHRVIVNYVSASPDHSIDVTIDGVMKPMGIARNSQCGGNHCKFSWIYKGMNFSLEPVTRKQNAEMSFDSWDTNEMRFLAG